MAAGEDGLVAARSAARRVPRAVPPLVELAAATLPRALGDSLVHGGDVVVARRRAGEEVVAGSAPSQAGGHITQQYDITFGVRASTKLRRFFFRKKQSFNNSATEGAVELLLLLY